MAKADINILWVEDSLGDIMLIQEAFEMVEVKYRLKVVNNGEEAMDFLNRRGRFARVVRPDLIILDLNLPGKSGREVMADLHADPNFSDIPIVILSGLPDVGNVCEGMDPKRCIYFSKPGSFPEMEDLAKKINDFWLSLA